MSRRNRNRYDAGDLVMFKFADKANFPCIILGFEEHANNFMGKKSYTYDVYISDVGVIRSVSQRDIRKWKMNDKEG